VAYPIVQSIRVVTVREAEVQSPVRASYNSAPRDCSKNKIVSRADTVVPSPQTVQDQRNETEPGGEWHEHGRCTSGNTPRRGGRYCPRNDFFVHWNDRLRDRSEVTMSAIAPLIGIVPTSLEWRRTGAFEWTFQRNTPAKGDALQSALLLPLTFAGLAVYHALRLLRRRPSPGACMMGLQEAGRPHLLGD
jgi:hypothetical protein